MLVVPTPPLLPEGAFRALFLNPERATLYPHIDARFDAMLNNGALDEVSLRRLVRHYASGPIDGFILAATSGEGLLLDTGELEHLVASVRAELADRKSVV